MASAKDIYESHVYRAGMYAAGMWRGTGTVEVPTPIATTHIVAMFTYARPLGDDILYQDATGALIVNRGYGPPAPITPDSALIVALYTFQGIDERIIQQDGAGVVKVRKGLT